METSQAPLFKFVDGLPEITTPRVFLRVARLDETPKIVRYLLKNQEHLRPWEPKRDASYFTEYAWRGGPERDRNEANAGTAFRFRMFLLTPIGELAPTDEFIGTISLRDISPWPTHSATIGYSLDHLHQGHGLMREAVSAVLKFAFETLHLKRVEACYMPCNVRSQRLLAELGFQQEGILRSSLEVNGQWEDHIICSCLNKDWRPTS